MKVAVLARTANISEALAHKMPKPADAKTDEGCWDKLGHQFDEDITGSEELLGKLLPSGEFGNIE
jgi:hypothetical protein